jgi:hypothetical protein
MSVKLKIEGTPDEIAAFLSHLGKADGIKLNGATEISKRGESHKWGSALAWMDVEPIEGLVSDYSVYQSKREPKAKGKKAGFIYLLPAYDKAGIVGYKIGKTTSPYSRRKSFGNKLYFEIEFIALIATLDYTELETRLHRHFAEKRQGRSEFFSLLPEDIAYIQAMMTDSDKKLLAQLNETFKK